MTNASPASERDPVIAGAAALDERVPAPADYAGYAEGKAWDAGGFLAPGALERATLAAELGGIALAGKRVLELGFGNGGFLAFAREAGAAVEGAEVQAELVERARAAGIATVDADLGKLLPARAGAYDLIVALDMFEHLSIAEVRSTLDAAAALLADGGHLLARFPNGQSPFGRVHQHGDTTHRSILSPDIMTQLVAGLPFAIQRNGDPARLPGLVAGLRFAAQRLVEGLLRRLYGWSVSLAPNSVVLLRRDPRSGAAE